MEAVEGETLLDSAIGTTAARFERKRTKYVGATLKLADVVVSFYGPIDIPSRRLGM